MISPYVYVPLYLLIGTILAILLLGLNLRLEWSFENIITNLKGDRKVRAIILSLPLTWFWFSLYAGISIAFM